MIDHLKMKCENMMTLIPTNLYIHSNSTFETIRYTNLTIPDFLFHYIEDAIDRLIKEKESLTDDEIRKNQVYYYIDPFKMCYLTWPIIDEHDETYTVTLGPIITDHLTAQEIKYIGYKMKLSSDNCFILESFYGIVPHFDRLQLIRIASMVLDYLPVVTHLPKIIKEDHSTILPEEAEQIENKFKPFDFLEKNYAAEERLLHAIELGDITFIKSLVATLSIDIPPRFPSDPLREYKNLSITLNSISLRAALKGGLNHSIAHSLSHNFAIQIESQTSVDAIQELNKEILITYTESVKKYALKNYTELVKNAVSYIRIHLTDHISLAIIAETLHVSKEHLSRKFKEEMQLSLTDFIHKTKAEESCNLLTSKKYAISDIAYIFGYSSPAHYTKMFKKFMFLSPKQYQKNNS